MIIDEEELRKAISILKPNNQLFEVRLISTQKKNKPYCGYFDNADDLVDKLKSFNDNTYNAYFTLNEINNACRSRQQYGQFIAGATTTSDGDIQGYNFLMVDLDSNRPADVSSSEEELEKTKEVAEKIYDYMKQVGFEKPVIAYSGNGMHLLYKIKIKNDKDRISLMKNTLLALGVLFSTAEIKVDAVNYNPSRICKLYGTVARKGRNTKERPHRMTRIVGDYSDGLKETDIEYLRKIVDILPKEQQPQKHNNYMPRNFDIEEWLSKYGLHYKAESYQSNTKYILDCCPFDSQHKGKDAVIIKSSNGAIGFHCFHNSCYDKTWKDVRLLFEPDAYEKRQSEYERRIYNTHNRDVKKEQKTIVEKSGKPVFYTANDIFNLPKQDEAFIRTGIIDIDKRLRGLKKGYVSVVSGLRASSKSTILSQIILNAIDTGNNVGAFSGELTARNFMRWMNLQAAGKGYVESTDYEGYYTTKRETNKKIAEWMNDRFWLYNNDYGNDFQAIISQFEKCIDEKSLDLLILDNLMAFNISGLSENKWDAQTRFVLELQKLAKAKNCHILFVAHPRKALGFLRLDDISGTGDLANAVDDAFIVHRINNDFKRLSKQMFGWKDDYDLFNATNCIEIAKDRDGGNCDIFVPLYYEKETKRLKNSISENIIYGWNKDENGFTESFDNPFQSI